MQHKVKKGDTSSEPNHVFKYHFLSVAPLCLRVHFISI